MNSVVISTGDCDDNQPIHEFALKNKIPLYAGSEMDLIDRFYKTALFFEADAIVRITGDCPLVDPKIVDQLVSEYVDNSNLFDIVRNSKTHSFPHGLEVEVYSLSSLKKMWDLIKQPELREWFPFFIDKNPELFRIKEIKNQEDLSQHRWTLDYPEDYEFVKKVYSFLYSELKMFYMDDILNLLKKEPSLTQINSKYVGHHNIGAPSI